MEFWLKFNNEEETLQLPVNPAEITVNSPFGFEDVSVSNFGEYTVIGNNQLRSYTISSFFPRDHNESFCAYSNLPEPWSAARQIERWQKSGKPVRFVVTGSAGIDIPATIRNFTFGERGGEPGDVYYALEMKEYVFIGASRKFGDVAKKSPEVRIAAMRPSTKETPSSYAVKSGDSLWKIAARVYGNGDDWRKIYDKNRTVIGANPNLLQPGQKLVIPSVGKN
ncbi:LysM peptidoglycan-binding domain-containing protein [Cohnella silvisoli]|uniref:LysM peptidoglycan-binding domain-containing protein n=1 Tax=Cohnella silvisoli TaxID=2873699 RepID=A0ABV1KYZ9_9BACL|nr:LysM peptidoglycan-binding domain-containing protein [Cohnella silvisoli]MCD9024311.1 LysM peptidoglycan-binding domain-containing protein [Cohnella silvisoli]